jgi:hypothetical protein
MVLEGRSKTQRGRRNAISVNIGHILQLQHPSGEPQSVHWDIGIDPEGAEAASGGSGDQLAPCRCADHPRTLPELPCIAPPLDEEQCHDTQNGPQSRNSPEDGQTPSEAVEGLLAAFDGLQAHVGISRGVWVG